MTSTYHLSSLLGPSTPVTRHPALSDLRDLPRLGRGQSFERAVVDSEGYAVALTSSNEGPAIRGELTVAKLRRMASGDRQLAALQDALWLLEGRGDRVDLAILRLKQDDEMRATLAVERKNEGLCESRLRDYLRALPGSASRKQAWYSLAWILGGEEPAKALRDAAIRAMPEVSR